MPRRSRKSGRRARPNRWRWRLLLLALLAGAVCLQAVLHSRWSTPLAPAGSPAGDAAVAAETELQARAAYPRRLARPVYRFSVIPGGAYNAEELTGALETDPVAARHYADFQRAQVRTEVSRFVQPVYVSYRVGDAIFWTRHPVALGAGETLLTDGASYARARCGNRVCVKPQLPVEAAGPAPGAMEGWEAPAPEVAAPRWNEALLAAEVFPAFSLETPAQAEAMLPAMIGESQEDPGLRLLALSGSLLPLETGAGSTPAAQARPPETPLDPLPIPELPLDLALSPAGCCCNMAPLKPGGTPGFPPKLPPCPPSDTGPDGPAGVLHGWPPDMPPAGAIPEPRSLWLALSGLGMAVAAAWRWRAARLATRGSQNRTIPTP